MSIPSTTNHQAAQWAERIRRSDLSEAEHAEFLEWVDRSPEHERAFVGQMKLEALATELREHPAVKRARWRRHLRGNASPRRWWSSARNIWLAGGLIAVSVGFISLRTWMVSQSYYSTVAGESREVHLDDGSVAFLNTRTTIRSHSDAHGRFVDLVNGEAVFSVLPDPSRPFIVNVHSTQIRVLGTQFNVYRRHDNRHDDVLLTVLDGTVDVSGAATAPGSPWHRMIHGSEELIFSSAGVVSQRSDRLAQRRTRWVDHVIEVENGTLADVVAELSRYTDAPIVLADSRLSDIRIVATLDVRTIAAALNQLQTIAPIRVERSGRSYVLHYRTDPAGKPVAAANQ
jgi:transmembrane sensor